MIELSCAVHLHSVHSDGTGTVAEIAAAAADAGRDVVLLTDHDTLAAREQGEEGWHGRVLVCVGTELTPRPGHHYLAFDLERPVAHRGRSPREMIEAVAEAGGFGFAAHPASAGSPVFARLPRAGWDDPVPERATGIELWSLMTDTVERFRSRRAAVRFLIDPAAARELDHPRRSLVEAWDRACAERRVVAIGGLDAHQFGVRFGRVTVRALSYRRSMALLGTHVLVERPLRGDADADRAAIYGALRAGRCFIARDDLAPARGFRFWADGPEHLEMGAEADARCGFKLHVRLPRHADLRLLRNGVEIARTLRGTSLDVPADEPGAYRVEASLQDRGRLRTWILSNPIYLR